MPGLVFDFDPQMLNGGLTLEWDVNGDSGHTVRIRIAWCAEDSGTRVPTLTASPNRDYDDTVSDSDDCRTSAAGRYGSPACARLANSNISIKGDEVGSMYISFFSCLRGRGLELSVFK